MHLCKAQLETGEVRVGVLDQGHVQLLDLSHGGFRTLSDILHADNPARIVQSFRDDETPRLPLSEVTLQAPIDYQEIWAAGVTYKRSQEARERESAGAARFYDLVYSAPRPELFFKATPARVAGPGERVRIRSDSKWNVPEPELALVISPRLEIVGYTIGNDMSSRDIEGENPLYLPQAKVYDRSCALGPTVALKADLPPLDRVNIHLTIERKGAKVFEGATRLSEMKRTFEELVGWLGRDNRFPHGAILLTGTGIVPPDDFTLASGDVVTIEITGIGRLVNLVEQAGAAGRAVLG
ncbi:2-hydroxyhepta-2,4-diene-1,7-dioate isomerase [Planctomycetaceae bacterium SCGC AG-212-F19]|nr:2-hydroxyhepta-2,4-diene-1,7-dioate isomerase [Planctomycetaceae bacterium SCGC AG-212-F19]